MSSERRVLSASRAVASEAQPPQVEALEGRVLLSLLGVALEYPNVSYDAGGTISYAADTRVLKSVDTPLTFFRNKNDRIGVAVKASQDPLIPRSVVFEFSVDGSGNVIGGVDGHDLVVTGWIDMNGNNLIDAGDYSGTLLTGEIMQFGYLDTGTNIDKYDFRFRATGGALMSFFDGKDVGIVMTSEGSTFTGSFGTNFGGGAKGSIGPIDALPGSLAGRVYVDANNDGLAQDAETGIGGVSIHLTGTTELGGAVDLWTATDDNGLYSFAGLKPGTYTITEVQPAGYLDGADSVGSLGGVADNDSFSFVIVDSAQYGVGYNFGELLPSASLAGNVYHDANNNNEFGAGEAGLAGVTVTLTGADDLGNEVNLVTITDGSGAYAFADLRPGSYTIAESQPGGYLDNVTGINSYAVQLAGGQDLGGYDFGEILPASLSGVSWVDFNDDGEIDFGERVITGVTITLAGTDDRGAAVSIVQATDDDGAFVFLNLRPGTYTLTETQPAGYLDGQEHLGTAGGLMGNDVFSGIVLGSGVDGFNYNFGERPLAGSAVVGGQTATIGFWQNKNGQALINSLNGGATATQLGHWLAATFPNMFGAQAGAMNLAGLTNAQIATIYQNAFKVKGVKLDAQVLAVAFATYVTNSSLAGSAASRYGFAVTTYGVGIATYNVGSSGAAFGVANNTVMTVLDILLATDEQAVNGVLYNGVTWLRNLANTVYDGINNLGDIS